MSTSTSQQMNIRKTTNSKLPQTDFDNLAFGRVFADHMLVASYENNHWQEIEILPFGEISLNPALSALHYGQSIFEGLKAYKTKNGDINLFRPLDNFKRMNKSAERMCMPSISEELFLDALKQLIDLDRGWVPEKDGTSLYIRPFMFASDKFIGLKASDSYKLIIFTCPVSTYYSEPVNVKIETKYTRAFPGGIGAAKTAGNYAASLYPAKLAKEEGFHQLIWTDGLEHKYIEEAGTMNVLFKIGNTILTPEPNNTVLDGITRRCVVQLAKDWGYDVQQRRVSVEEIISAIENNQLDDAFGAGTAATISHIASLSLEGKKYELPAIEKREFSNKVLQTLDDIKYGRVEDPHNWIVKI